MCECLLNSLHVGIRWRNNDKSVFLSRVSSGCSWSCSYRLFMIIETLSSRFIQRQLIPSGLGCLKEWRERKIERDRERGWEFRRKEGERQNERGKKKEGERQNERRRKKESAGRQKIYLGTQSTLLMHGSSNNQSKVTYRLLMHGSPNNQSKVTYKFFTNARFPQ